MGAGALARRRESGGAGLGGDHGLGVVKGLNVLKDGKDPSIRPDSEYPDWVFELCAPHALRARRRAPSLHAADDASLIPFPQFCTAQAQAAAIPRGA